MRGVVRGRRRSAISRCLRLERLQAAGSAAAGRLGRGGRPRGRQDVRTSVLTGSDQNTPPSVRAPAPRTGGTPDTQLSGRSPHSSRRGVPRGPDWRTEAADRSQWIGSTYALEVSPEARQEFSSRGQVHGDLTGAWEPWTDPKGSNRSREHVPRNLTIVQWAWKCSRNQNRNTEPRKAKKRYPNCTTTLHTLHN